MGRASTGAGDREEESRRKAQEVDYKVNQNWTAVYKSIARRTWTKVKLLIVSAEQVLCPNEPSANTERIARQARSETRKKLFQIISRQGANQIPVTSMARWEEHLRS